MSRSPTRWTMILASLLLAWLIHTVLSAQTIDSPTSAPFGIQVVDEQTGRGVPLVELTTTNDIRLITDNAGWIAFDEPGLMNQRVYFSVKSHGYSLPADGFGNRGQAFDVRPGETGTIKIQRHNLAERLYRVTGQGQFHHSVKLGKPVPWEYANLNGEVMGQDSTQAIQLGDRILWTWGDTARPSYPLGNFATSGAWSKLPAKGGMDPSIGIDQQYLVDQDGFSKPMFVNDIPGTVIWMHGMCTVDAPNGQTKVLTHYSIREGLGKERRAGIAMFNESTEQFDQVTRFEEPARLYPRGQSFHHVDDGQEYIYFATPYPLIRVAARWDAVLDPTQYEAWTCLEEGFDLDLKKPALARDGDGKLQYAWRKNTDLVGAEQQRQLVERGEIKQEEAWIQTVDAQSGRKIVLHRGSVRWNDYLDCWVMIANEIYGESSNLGEVYILTSKTLPGQWSKAEKVVTHDHYTFYNPVHHDFLDQDGGRRIYFDGTYTKQFSAKKFPTPRYDYNTIMYGLDLSQINTHTN
ncbi:hypothetical protein [Bremerella cremea]|uniref:hypothetical protein n=1 Tax=Bremerella cremea TaxID=1031537 RepID=UPI0031F1BFC5